MRAVTRSSLRLRILAACFLLLPVLFIYSHHTPAAKTYSPTSFSATTGASGVRKLTAIPFAQTPQIELKLDLYLPPATDGHPAPVLVWIHGGSWTEGGRGFCPISPLARDGYAVASISYRFSQQAVFPAQIQDSKAAIRWLRAHAREYNLDPNRIAACGESAGAQLAALLGTSGGVSSLEGDEGNPAYSSRVQAVVDLCGPTDFTIIDHSTREAAGLLFSFNLSKIKGIAPVIARDRIVSKYLGGDDKEKARAASPITYVSKESPPFFIVHGDSDYLVPISQSESIRDALQKSGVYVDLDVIKGAGHGFGRISPPMLLRIRNFLDTHFRALLPTPTTPTAKAS